MSENLIAFINNYYITKYTALYSQVDMNINWLAEYPPNNYERY